MINVSKTFRMKITEWEGSEDSGYPDITHVALSLGFAYPGDFTLSRIRSSRPDLLRPLKGCIQKGGLDLTMKLTFSCETWLFMGL